MLNHIVIEGRLARDPEIRFYDDGKSVCNIDVAVERDFKTKNGEKETDYFKCVCWDGEAEKIDKFLKKGKPIGLIGSMQNNKYVEKETGKTRDKWQLRVIKSWFVPRDNTPTNGFQSAPSDGNAPVGFTPVDETTDDEELPF